MAKFTQWVQQKSNRKWLYIFGGLAVVIVLFMLLRGGSRGSGSGAGSVIQTGPSEAIQSAQISAGVEQTAINAGLQAQSIDAQAAVQIETLRSANEALSIERSLDALVIQEQGADRADQRAFEAGIFGLRAERDIALAGIGSQQAVSLANIEGSIARDRIAAQSVVAQQSLFMQGQVALEQARSSVGIAQADAAVQIEQSRQSTTRLAISRAKKKHVASIVGGQESKGFSLGFKGFGFSVSDIRRKKNIRPTGQRIDGIPSYTFEVAGAPGLQAGVMAQELERIHPEFVLNTPRGLMVDYIRLDAAA